MDIENQIEEPVVDSIRSDLEKAFADSEPVQEAIEAEGKPDRARDESGKFAKKPDEVVVKPIAEAIPEAPRSWTADEKAKWTEATPEVRKAILRREQEVEQGFTKLDEDRNFGKTIKEALTPYLPVITAEGGNPTEAFKEFLNTSYILRTAPLAQKTALFHQLAQRFGVDLSQPNNPSAVQPDQVLAATQQQLAELRQQIQQQPEVFRQQQEKLAINSLIDAFAADPKNVHYEKLKPVMASLLQAGQARDMQDAYDKASWADPDVRSAMQADKIKEAETQRIAEIKAKADLSRKAAVSVRGAPGVMSVPNGKSNGSIADDLRAAWDEHA